MTKHFRKEHPAESLDHDEDADYSDVEPSEDDPSVEQDGTDSGGSADYLIDSTVKLEPTNNAAASNYNANLWRLPAQTAQRSTQAAHTQSGANLATNHQGHTVKLERSASHASQRNMTDPALSGHVAAVGYGGRANMLPLQIPRSHGDDLAMWQAQQLHDSPHSISSDPSFSVQDLNNTSPVPTHFQQVLPIRRPSLQPVHDIILDDPRQGPYTQESQQNFNSTPTPQYNQTPPDFREEMPRTPAPGQQLPHFSSGLSNAQYQEPHSLPLEEYNNPAHNDLFNMSQARGVSLYIDPLDAYKELKMEDNIYTQMPEATYGWS
ncbi:uncharacterized protein KY384_004302 [Bacidia gigantensis]|uniref:uncharacterized protein n=1 Tax=Bacidia gigantensis TaxID=2732470 RepID=UPI001D04626D|nr:uncharacterized protein KY384_004302 [Bacidia gigantensis]KAG8530945.1 hypothetical protein KY384_004302 [Bacidia gigantensis]